MTDWWIYENWRALPGGQAIVHKGSCPWCNHGRGIHWKRREMSDENGKWHGPYFTKDYALVHAQQLGKRETRFCKYCCHFSVQRVISCPDCGQPMRKNSKRAEYMCENSSCPVISVRVAEHSMRILKETSSTRVHRHPKWTGRDPGGGRARCRQQTSKASLSSFL